MIKEITSTKNPTYKFIRSLKNKKARAESGCYTVEGIKSVRDAIASGADINCVVLADGISEEFECDKLYRVSETLFSALCDTEAPQGVLAVINMPKKTAQSLSGELYLFCDRITDPGNMGTIIRICDAADCGLLLSEGCVDIYGPKVVRSSMGSFFRTMPVCGLKTEDLRGMKSDGYKIISGALGNNTVDFRTADYSGKTVIVVGNEANGISREILDLSDRCVKIPIWGGAESLNVGVAAALLVYEARRNLS